MTSRRPGLSDGARPTGTLSELYRLVEAIDRRVPRPERGSEAHIARDAANLRARAVARIEHLESRPTVAASGTE